MHGRRLHRPLPGGSPPACSLSPSLCRFATPPPPLRVRRRSEFAVAEGSRPAAVDADSRQIHGKDKKGSCDFRAWLPSMATECRARCRKFFDRFLYHFKLSSYFRMKKICYSCVSWNVIDIMSLLNCSYEIPITAKLVFYSNGY